MSTNIHNERVKNEYMYISENGV